MTFVVELDGITEPPFSALRWSAGQGMHVVLTDPGGGELLAELVTGTRRPRRGRVRVAGRDPARSPSTRRSIVSLLAHEQLLEAQSVRMALELEFRIRGVRLDAAAVLEDWGLGRLSSAKPAELEPAERRGIRLAAALGLPDPALVALVEPFADNAALSRERIRQRLLALAKTSCVLCASATPRDAVELGGTAYLTRAGRLDPLAPPITEPLAGLFGYLVVSCDQPRALVGALAAEPDVAGLEWRDHAGDRVLVWGPNAEAVARAVVRGARSGHCGLKSIVVARASLELVRAAQSGWARAVHEQAWWLGRGTGAPPSASAPHQERST
jgi:ABC-2 type transport system ATP-binding protein